MKIRLLSYNRRIHVPATSRLAIAGALGVGWLGVFAGGCGIVLAARGNDDGQAIVEVPVLATVETTSVPPTMVLLPPPTTSTAPSADADRELGYVLRGLYSAVLLASGAVADPDHPGLRAYATGEALLQVQEAIRARSSAGLALRGSRDGKPSVIRVIAAKVSGDSATAAACETETHELYDVTTGDTIDDEVVVRELRVDFIREGGGWKATKVHVGSESSGSCSAAPA